MSDRGEGGGQDAGGGTEPGGTPGVPGWYPDPWSGTKLRYWTGSSWTFSTRDAGAAAAAPPLMPPSAATPRPLPEDVAPPRPAAPAPPPPPPPPPPAQTPPPALTPPPPSPPPPSPTPPLATAPIPPVAPPTAPPPATPLPPEGRSPGVASRAAKSFWGPKLVPALIVGLVLGLIGAALFNRSRSSSSSSRTSGGQAASPTTRPTGPGGASGPGGIDPSLSALATVVVNQSDVGPGLTVAVFSGGSGLGQPTLDLCNGTFPSESRRTARLQDAVVAGQDTVTLSTEAVLYADSAATTQAFSELKDVAARCPTTPVRSPVGEPTVITTFNAPPDGGWPQTPTVDRLAFDFTTDDGNGTVSHSIAVYLRRGRALVGVYFSRPDGPQAAVAGQTTISGIVGVFASRLAALPTSVVGS